MLKENLVPQWCLELPATGPFFLQTFLFTSCSLCPRWLSDGCSEKQEWTTFSGQIEIPLCKDAHITCYQGAACLYVYSRLFLASASYWGKDLESDHPLTQCLFFYSPTWCFRQTTKTFLSFSMMLVILSGFLKELKMILGTEDTRASIPLVLHIYDPGFESQHH